MFRINQTLAEKQGLGKHEIATIEELMVKLHEILDNPESVELGETDKVSDVVQAFEYVLQVFWHFPCNSNYHRYQNRISGCLCPSIDNADMVGTKYRYVNGGCPFHGEIE